MIVVDAITKSFREPVLGGVSFSVPKGGIFTLIGPGASGKSVLLKIMGGLLKPDSGSVSIDGGDVTSMDELQLAEMRKRVGMLFQNYALFDFMTVGDNIAFPLRRLFDLPESEVMERVAERLERVALPGFEDRQIGGLSGGQKKRVGVARATITRPDVILYDEPTAGLDPVTSQKIYDLIRDEQQKHGTTAFCISSDLNGVFTITDTVAMLYKQNIVFEGTVKEARAATDPAVRQFVHGLTEGPL